MNRLVVSLQALLPHHLLCRGMHWLTHLHLRPVKNILIKAAIRLYDIDMSVAETEEPAAYETFNRFFTRALKPGARPIAEADTDIACPVDGTVSQAGCITKGRLLQAKGRDYSLTNLLGGSNELAMLFKDGCFATLYLSPRDYHRIHMPLSGRLRETIYVPGRLFSVNDRSARHIPNLFARNERLVTVFDTANGPMAVILVGALFVSGIETVWSGAIDSCRKTIHHKQADDTPVILEKGQEMGRFNMGSTVIVLFGAGRATLAADITRHAPVRMGQRLATLNPAPGKTL